MTEIWFQAALWLGLALIATILSIYLRTATALSEIVVGTIAQLIIGALLGTSMPIGDASWMQFLSGAGATLLTFLAGAELDPTVFKKQWKRALIIGLISFFLPFFLCTALVWWCLDRTPEASWLAGIAMPATSVVVVYAVVLELGINTTGYGKTILAACFVTDLTTVIALGLVFAPFTLRTVTFTGTIVVAAFFPPWLTPRFFKRFGDRPSELEAKFLMLCLFALDGLASWADSEAVLPAYLIGMVLTGTAGKDHVLIRRLRMMTPGLLIPFYFIRAGSLVSLPALTGTPGAFLTLFLVKMLTKLAGAYPACRWYGSSRQESMYTTLLMSTGLILGTISVLFGLSRHLIGEEQYSPLTAAVIGSAVLPTLIVNAFFLPHYMLPESDTTRHVTDEGMRKGE